MNNFIRIIFMSLIMSIGVIDANAQGFSAVSTDTVSSNVTGPTILPPLFEYPVAPDDLNDWQERSGWLVEHFWENFDFKQKAVGQAQLNHAFKTFTVPMRFAKAKTVMKTIDDLISKLKKNPGLLLQFTMAAERNIYDPATAEAIVDEVYLPFLQALVKCKKLPEIRRAKYKMQLEALDGCLTGDKIKPFSFVDKSGVEREFVPTAPFSIIEFGDPDCSECRIVRLRIETDEYIRKAIESGKLQLTFIIPDVDPDAPAEWMDSVQDYAEYWTVGASSDLEQILDLRHTPCIYILGAEGKILSKNGSREELHEIMKREQ